MRLDKHRNLLKPLAVWVGSIVFFFLILGVVELKAGVTDFSQIKGTFGLVLVGAFLVDILLGIIAFFLLCAELLRTFVFNRVKVEGETKSNNPLEKVSLARFLSRVLLSFFFALVFGLLSLPFLSDATNLSFEEKSKIGNLNMWKVVFIFGLLAGLFAVLSFWKKRLRLTSAFLVFFWLIGVSIAGLINYVDTSRQLSPQKGTLISNSEQICDRSSCPDTGVNDAKNCTVLVFRDDGGHGSGFSVEKGFIVTNKHVIEGAKKLSTFIDGEKDLTLWNYSPTFDVAVLKLPVEIPTCKWFDSSQLTLAEQLFATGWPNQPLGESTVTAGIYSRTNVFEGGLEFIQTDAPINPGNSGGPLVNKYGIVGMTTLKEVWSSEDIPLEGLGNALSSKFLIPIVEQLINEGEVSSNYPNTPSYYASQQNVPAPKTTPAINVNEINQYLAELRVVKGSWENCNRCPKEDLDKLIDLFNRQIAFCETISQRLSVGQAPSQDDLRLWDGVVKMSYESSAIAQKLNQF